MGTFIVLGILVVVIILAAGSSLKHMKGQGGCCGGGDSVEKVKRKKFAEVFTTKRMLVEGMHCDNCRKKVENTLNSLEHVSAKVNLAQKEATIQLETDVADEILIHAVEKAGYQVASIERIE